MGLTYPRALRAHFSSLEEASDEPGVNEARGYACEYVAWQFLTCLSERDTLDYLLYELPSSAPSRRGSERENNRAVQNGNSRNDAAEDAPLLNSNGRRHSPSGYGTDSVHADSTTVSGGSSKLTSKYENLSALEIAAVSSSKKFLSQRPVQRILNGLWRVRLGYVRAMLCLFLLIYVGRYRLLGNS